MFYLFHGPNSLARDEELGKMKAKLGEPDIASLNTTLLDKTAQIKDLMAAADTMPFLSDKRLVIAQNLIAALGAPKGRKAKGREAKGVESTERVERTPLQQLIEYLPTMSDTTRLIFAEDETLAPNHPLVELASNKDSGGHLKLFDLPDNPIRWISERAKQKGGEMSPQAAQLLSTKINRGDKNDRDHYVQDSRTYLHKLDNELEKLVAYALGRRVEANDVELLVRDEDIADIFKFIDAISLRDGDGAFKFVRGVLVRGESPLVVLSHLARQTRLLIQAKEHADLSPDALAQHIGVHPFVAKKVSQQAQRFTIVELESAHAAILDADIAIKTGRMDEVTALDVLVAAFCS